MNPGQLVAALRWRYAVKQFDPTRHIAGESWDALEESLVLTPSSYGLQPWKFLIVSDPAVRERLVAHSWGQRQVADASHLPVFLARTKSDESDIDRFIQRTADVRGVTTDSLAGFRNMLLKDIVRGPRAEAHLEWAKCQCYIALGQFMLAAAALGIDTCPMEGFDPEKFSEELGLTGSGWTPVVLCPAGYRSPEDTHASRAKVRFPREEVVIRQ